MLCIKNITDLTYHASLGVSQRAGLRRGPGTSFSAFWLPMKVRYKLKHMTDNYLVYDTTLFQNMGHTNRHTVLLEARYSSLTNAGLFLLKPFLIQTLLCFNKLGIVTAQPTQNLL